MCRQEQPSACSLRSLPTIAICCAEITAEACSGEHLEDRYLLDGATSQTSQRCFATNCSCNRRHILIRSENKRSHVQKYGVVKQHIYDRCLLIARARIEADQGECIAFACLDDALPRNRVDVESIWLHGKTLYSVQPRARRSVSRYLEGQFCYITTTSFDWKT